MAEKKFDRSGGKTGRLPAEVVRLGWISFFTDIASEMAYPVIPLFLTAALGASALALGAVEGVAEAVVSVMSGLSGWHSDRIWRRVPYIRWGYGLGAAAKPALAASFAWPMVLFARGMDRFGKGLRTSARDALIADAVSEKNAGRGFGLHRAMDTAGALVGSLFAVALLHFLPREYRLIFLIATVPGAVAVALTFLLKERRRPDSEIAAASLESVRKAACSGNVKGVSLSGFRPGYWKALAILMLFALANSSDAFLLIRMKGFGYSDSMVVFIYAFYNLTYAAVSYPAGALSDRVGRWPVMAAGWALYSAVYLGFAVVRAPSLVWPLFALYGVYMGMTHGVGKAIIAGLAPADKKGTALGIFQMGSGLAALSSSLIAGFLWDRFGPAAPFWFGGVAALAAAALVPLVARGVRSFPLDSGRRIF